MKRIFPPIVRWSAMTLISLALTGCAVDQKKEVEHYRSVLDQNTPGAPAYDGRSPLTLLDAMSLANANNEQLSRRGEDYVQALIEKNRAIANFLPTISLQPSYTIEDAPRNASASPSLAPGGYARLGSRQLQRFDVPVVGNLNLFRGGGDIASLRAAESNIEAQKQFLLDLQATTLLNVAQTYYAVLRAERSVAVLQNSLNLQEARLSDVEQQFKNGLATRLSVSQTRAQADQTRVNWIAAQNDVLNGRTTLALVIGVPAVDGPLLDVSYTQTPLPDESYFEAQATQFRPDLVGAAAAVATARANVDAAVAQYYPSVSLNVAGFLYRQYYADATRWDAILGANLPIFSAGLIEADVRTAWSRLRQALLDESYARRSALADVQTSHHNLLTADKRIEQLKDEVQAATEAYEQARSAYQNNLAINLDVLNAQDQKLSAELQLTTAQIDRSIYYLDLLRATGKLSPKDLLKSPTTQP